MGTISSKITKKTTSMLSNATEQASIWKETRVKTVELAGNAIRISRRHSFRCVFFHFASVMKSSSWDDEPMIPKVIGTDPDPMKDKRLSVHGSSRKRVRKAPGDEASGFEPSSFIIENVAPTNACIADKPVAIKRKLVVRRDPAPRIEPKPLVPREVSTNRSPAREIVDRPITVVSVAANPVAEPLAVVDAPAPKPKRRKKMRDFKSAKPEGSISAPSGNYVYQDLKGKGGCSSSKGAETLRRRITIARNERWREANGIRRRGKRAANFRRQQLSREMAHERNLLEAVSDESIGDMFSSGVDRAWVLALAEKPTIMEESSPLPEISPTEEDLLKFLESEFGHSAFRAGQLEAITAALSGERSLVILPTGTGKSLCYQFPSVFLRKVFHQKNALTVVISPLIALMTDQLKLLPKCCRGAAIHSNLSPTQTGLVHAAIAAGGIDVLFLAPERLLMYSMQDVLKSVALVAVDEAHCMSEWSHSFRPAYLAVSKVIDEQIKPRALLALTATATVQTVESLQSVLSIGRIVRSAATVQRDNLELFARRSANPVMDMIEFLSRPELARVGPIIVYVQYKWQTENVSNVLRERGFGAAEAYHGGLSAQERREIHDKFINNEVRFVVATVAFGMGIDKRNVRAVIHLTLPKSIENYVQETGRCSRDNKVGYCRCFFNGEDYARVRTKAESEALQLPAVRDLVGVLADPPADAILTTDSGDRLMFVEEQRQEPLLSKQHLSLLLSLVEARGAIGVFHGFPRAIKLRFFAQSLAELAEIDPFMELVHRSPLRPKVDQTTVVENSGVATIDLVSAIAKTQLSPPQFMHKLAQAAKANKFAVAKSEWGHIVSLRREIDVEETALAVFDAAISNHRLEMNRLDASFALLSRIAAESLDDEKIGHKLIQLYFLVEERMKTGEDLVPSVLEGAPLGIARNITREINDIRQASVRS